jgi:hypothetical protein
MQFQVTGLSNTTKRRLSQTPLLNATSTDIAGIQGYVPYGNATLATPEQMKEFKGPQLTQDRLYRMFGNEGPGVPFNYESYSARNVRSPSQGAYASAGRQASDVTTLGPALTATVLALLSIACTV